MPDIHLRPFFRSCSPDHVPLEREPFPKICLNKKRKASKAQARDDRYLIWLRAYEHGIYDPISGCQRPRSIWEIAQLWKTPIRTVRYGIQAARRLQDRIREVADRE